jgi:hypothetical protein
MTKSNEVCGSTAGRGIVPSLLLRHVHSSSNLNDGLMKWETVTCRGISEVVLERDGSLCLEVERLLGMCAKTLTLI